jgi:hypothetical protein
MAKRVVAARRRVMPGTERLGKLFFKKIFEEIWPPELAAAEK